jgi:transposase
VEQYLYDLDRRLDRTLATARRVRLAVAAQAHANRAHLFVFVANRSVPYTNNVPERHLRPSVVFRKVTNGFRCR